MYFNLYFSYSGFTDTVLDIFNVTNITVDTCVFKNNFNNGSGNASFRGNAGAIAIGYSNESSLTNEVNITIRNSTFINNTAITDKSTDEVLMQKVFAGRGGAIALYIPSPNSTVWFMSECNHFIDNCAEAAGGGIYAHLSGNYADVTLHVRNCCFIGNKAQDGAGIEFTYDLNNSSCVIPNDNFIGQCAVDGTDCLSSVPECPRYIPAKSIIEYCHFEENRGGFGGAFKGIQINPFGNNNLITFKNCTFMNNIANVGAGAYFQSRYSVADVKMNNSIQMENWYVIY